ncbi:MAG: outer membrane beta-barrel protein [Bacteroidota bacterium]
MKRYSIVVVLCFMMASTAVRAQKSGPSVGLGADFAFPQNNFGNNASYGVGPSILFQNGISKNLNYTINVAYLKFNGDGVFANVKYREAFVPIKAGLRYFFSEYIYGAGEAGISISSANGSGSGTAFAYAPTIGVEFPVSNRGSIDAGVRYEGWSRSNGTRSFIGLRAGYNF